MSSDHLLYLEKCIELAKQSPPLPTNFRVGCVIVSTPSNSVSSILSTGYTLELEGNTHAEQCALTKLAKKFGVNEDNLDQVLTPDLNITLYTSLEPCGKRLSGNLPCVQRIINTKGIRNIVFGAKEPGTFVKDSQSCQILTEAGINWKYIPDLEDSILQVAMEGHVKSKGKGASIDDISEEEKKRQQALPKNPKKRMMEVDI